MQITVTTAIAKENKIGKVEIGRGRFAVFGLFSICSDFVTFVSRNVRTSQNYCEHAHEELT